MLKEWMDWIMIGKEIGWLVVRMINQSNYGMLIVEN